MTRIPNPPVFLRTATRSPGLKVWCLDVIQALVGPPRHPKSLPSSQSEGYVEPVCLVPWRSRYARNNTDTLRDQLLVMSWSDSSEVCSIDGCLVCVLFSFL